MKSAASTELLEAVRTVARGGTFVRSSAARVLAEAWTRRTTQDDADTRYTTLSDREREVFRLTALGHSPASIGEQLSISAKTVDTYRRRVTDKLDLSDRVEWVRLALRLGLLAEGAEG